MDEFVPTNIPEFWRFLDHYILLELYESRGYFLNFAAFRCEGLDDEILRLLFRRLRRRRYVKFQTGLFSDDGETWGSGYAITHEGSEYFEDLNEMGFKNEVWKQHFETPRGKTK